MRRELKLAIGLVIALVLLVWAFKDVDFVSLGRALSSARLAWIGAAVLSVGLSVAFVVWRWWLLLDRPMLGGRSESPWLVLWHATLAAQVANIVVPFRLGDSVRIVAASQALGLGPARAASAAVIKRLTDATTLGVIGIGAMVLALWTWTFTAGVAFSPAFVVAHALWFLSVPIWVVALAPTRHTAVVLDLQDILTGIARAGAVLFVVYLGAFFYAGRNTLPRLVALYVLWNCTSLAVAGRLILVRALTRSQSNRRFTIVGDSTAGPTALALFERPAL